MKTIVGYEIKKILMKKSTLAALLLLLGIQLVIAIAGSLGNTYVDDVFVETHMEKNRIDREHGMALSGRAIDEALLAEVREAYQKLEGDGRQYLLSEVYRTEIRKYADLADKIRMWGYGSIFSFDNMTEISLYEIREENRNALWDSYGLSDKERQYWLEKEAELTIPFTYEYATAYDYLLNMNGGYMTCMLLTFFIAVSMVNVFTEEHSRKTDQVLLCTRFGRGRLYTAKLLAGSIVILAVNLLFILIAAAGNFLSYGTEGFDAMVQLVTVFAYSYSLTVGETLLIVIGLLLLSSVMVAIFTMVLAEALRNNVGAMAIVTGGLFTARIVTPPLSWKFLSKAWNYIPINLLKMDQGFTDPRLVSVCGLQLPTWQFAPILYVLMITVFILVGGRIYKGYQISGR